MAHCLSSEGINSGSLSLHSPQTGQNMSFLAIDVYAKLVILILKVIYTCGFFGICCFRCSVSELILWFILCLSVLCDGAWTK